MDFKDYLKINAQKVETELEKILSEFLSDAKNLSPKLSPLAKGFINSCIGGKRIRGVLVKLGYEIAMSFWGALATPESKKRSWTSQDDIIRVGAALEILHAAILVHDDIIDQSPTRRGQPTLHKSLGGDYYGISQSIVLGDIGLYLQTKIVTETSFPAERKIKALNHLSKMIINTGWGEALDVELPHLGKTVSLTDVKLIQILKTAQYTISGPLILGAILASGKATLIKLFEEFGEYLGIAFQIQDDILGIFGKENQIGKSTTSDIEEGKITYLYTYALEKADKQQLLVINKYYGKGKISSKELEKVREVFRECKALDLSLSLAVEYALKAKKMIPKITHDKNMIKMLEQMCEYLVERTV